MEIQQKAVLWKDAKFLWLIASVALVAVFEFLSLSVPFLRNPLSDFPVTGVFKFLTKGLKLI